MGVELHQAAERLLNQADSAMYSAKNAGGGQCRAHDPRVETESQRMSKIRQAIRDGDIVLYYQPIVSLERYLATMDTEASIVGYEALARWLQPSGDIVGPGQFIQLLESRGEIHLLCQHVIRTVAAKQNQIVSTGRWISLNISPMTLDRPDFCRIIYPLLGTKAHPEITERQQLSPSGQQRVRRLRQQGLKVALDDFGAEEGQSRLQLLAQGCCDLLKLDIARTQDDSPNGVVICESLIQIAHRLTPPIQVVAEGVETLAQAQRMHRLGCDLGQGYLFGKAGPLG